MPLIVRLDKKTESLLEQTASALKTSKTEVIKQSLLDYCDRVLTERRRRPYDLIKDLLGKEGSGRGEKRADFEKEVQKYSSLTTRIFLFIGSNRKHDLHSFPRKYLSLDIESPELYSNS